jgi:hypothetical protein
MCFRNLPIEFDTHGRAQLRDDQWGQTVSVEPTPEPI